MNALRVIVGWLEYGFQPRRYPHDPPAVDGLTCEQRAVLMRRGPGDCHVAEHAHALQRLGHVTRERDDALDTIRLQHRLIEVWERRALTAEAKLQHHDQQAA